MEQTQTKQNGRPKLELQLNQTLVLSLTKDKPYTGESSFGAYYLYQVADPAGVVYSFFAPVEIHSQILQSGLKTGDQFRLTKRAVQNGKKVGAKLEFESLKKQEQTTPTPQPKQDDVPFDIPDDGFKELMKRCVQEAVEIVKEVNTIPWQNEDVRAISLSLFIQRAKVG